MKLVEVARFVSDLPAAVDSYRQLLGVEPFVDAPGIAIFKVNEVQFLIHERYQPGPDGLPCEDHLAFGTTDLETACSALSAAGFTIERAPADYEWGRSAYLRDLDGRLIELALTPD